jgi:hypothetical protein
MTCVPSYGERAFSVAAPKLWNKLPMGLMTCTDLLDLLQVSPEDASFQGCLFGRGLSHVKRFERILYLD